VSRRTRGLLRHRRRPREPAARPAAGRARPPAADVIGTELGTSIGKLREDPGWATVSGLAPESPPETSPAEQTNEGWRVDPAPDGRGAPAESKPPMIPSVWG
jgi:hypothetical protein